MKALTLVIVDFLSLKCKKNETDKQNTLFTLGKLADKPDFRLKGETTE
ncbi:hypothetical protein [Catenovulum maritimum]|nr:hypothetical protein [Catenovulum maritimum]